MVYFLGDPWDVPPHKLGRLVASECEMAFLRSFFGPYFSSAMVEFAGGPEVPHGIAPILQASRGRAPDGATPFIFRLTRVNKPSLRDWPKIQRPGAGFLLVYGPERTKLRGLVRYDQRNKALRLLPHLRNTPSGNALESQYGVAARAPDLGGGDPVPADAGTPLRTGAQRLAEHS